MSLRSPDSEQELQPDPVAIADLPRKFSVMAKIARLGDTIYLELPNDLAEGQKVWLQDPCRGDGGYWTRVVSKAQHQTSAAYGLLFLDSDSPREQIGEVICLSKYKKL